MGLVFRRQHDDHGALRATRRHIELPLPFRAVGVADPLRPEWWTVLVLNRRNRRLVIGHFHSDKDDVVRSHELW